MTMAAASQEVPVLQLVIEPIGECCQVMYQEKQLMQEERDKLRVENEKLKKEVARLVQELTQLKKCWPIGYASQQQVAKQQATVLSLNPTQSPILLSLVPTRQTTVSSVAPKPQVVVNSIAPKPQPTVFRPTPKPQTTVTRLTAKPRSTVSSATPKSTKVFLISNKNSLLNGEVSKTYKLAEVSIQPAEAKRQEAVEPQHDFLTVHPIPTTSTPTVASNLVARMPEPKVNKASTTVVCATVPSPGAHVYSAKNEKAGDNGTNVVSIFGDEDDYEEIDYDDSPDWDPRKDRHHHKQRRSLGASRRVHACTSRQLVQCSICEQEYVTLKRVQITLIAV